MNKKFMLIKLKIFIFLINLNQFYSLKTQKIFNALTSQTTTTTTMTTVFTLSNTTSVLTSLDTSNSKMNSMISNSTISSPITFMNNMTTKNTFNQSTTAQLLTTYNTKVFNITELSNNITTKKIGKIFYN